MMRIFSCWAALVIGLAMGLAGCRQAIEAPAQAQAPVVETIPGGPQARAHVPDAVAVDYGTPFPTSGMHSEVWAKPGFYTEPQPRPRLVHALEHGQIVIYYGDPGDAAMNLLRSWASEFTGEWDGVVVVPEASLGGTVVLTAWEKRLVLEKWDDLAAGAFLDAYRGRGPEHPVR